MAKLDFVKKPGFQKGLGIAAAAVVAGISAISSTLSEQKKEQEFEDLKKAVNDLQNK